MSAASPPPPTPLPAPIAAYLAWGRQHLAAAGTATTATDAPADAAAASSASSARSSTGNDDDDAAAGIIPGAPLCRALPIPGEGVGIVAARDLPPGAHRLFRVPASAQFRPEHTSFAHLLPAPASAENAWIRCTLALLIEWARSSSPSGSSWGGFIASMHSLVPRCDQPQFWNEGQRMQLQGCSFADRVDFFDLDHEYAKVTRWVAEHSAELRSADALGSSVDLDTCFSRARFEQATGWMISRAFRPTCAPELGPTLVPLVDLFNTTTMQLEAEDEQEDEQNDEDGAARAGSKVPRFHRKINTSVSWVGGGPEGNDLSNPTLLIHTRADAGPIRAGQQLYLPYGTNANLSSADLLIRYGFLEGSFPHWENPNDCIQLSALDVVNQLQGGAGQAGGSGALTNPAEAEEDEEADLFAARHRKEKLEKRLKRKQAGTAADADASAAPAAAKGSPSSKSKSKAASAAAAASSTAAASDDADDDSDSSSVSSSSSSSSHSLQAHLALASELPVECFVLPRSGELPPRLLQWVGVVLGLVKGSDFLQWIEGDAARERARTEATMSAQKDLALGGESSARLVALGVVRAPGSSPVAVCTGEEEGEEGEGEGTRQGDPPCPSPSEGLHELSVNTPRADSSAAAAAATAASSSSSAPAASPSPASSPSSSAAALKLVRSHPDVLEACFFLFHALIANYATTLEQDVSLEKFFVQREEERVKEWRTSQRASSAASSAAASPAQQTSSPPEPSADATRMLLALRVRMGEKRILYRALEQVQSRLAQLAAAEEDDEDMAQHDEDEDDDEGEGVEHAGAPGAAGAASSSAAAASGAAAFTFDSDVESGDDSSRNPDPTLLSPSLFRMPASASAAGARNSAAGGSKRPLSASARGSGSNSPTAAQDDDEAAETKPAAASTSSSSSSRFTYTRASAAAPATKKRRS